MFDSKGCFIIRSSFGIPVTSFIYRIRISLNGSDSGEALRLIESYWETSRGPPNENSPVLPKEHEAAGVMGNQSAESVHRIQVEPSDIIWTDGAVRPGGCLDEHVDHIAHLPTGLSDHLRDCGFRFQDGDVPFLTAGHNP